MKKKNWEIIISAFLGIISMAIVKFDKNFDYQWLAFGIHTLAIFWLFFVKLRNEKLFAGIRKKDWMNLGLVMALAIIFGFIFLKNYPFVSRGDELRDGGLDARRIFNGDRKNLFGWGFYNGYGLIVPTFTSFFYLFFGDSVLTYRVFAALLSVLDIFLVWLISYKLFNKMVAFFSSLVLISLPLHLFYARTEVVVMFSSFLTSLCLLVFFDVYRKKRLIDWMTLAVLVGWCFNFHASIKTVSFSLAVISLIYLIWRLLRSKRKLGWLTKLLLFPVFILLGFGPRLWQTPLEIFFNEKKNYMVVNQINKTEYLKKLEQRYMKSLMVWYYEPTTSHFENQQPILSPFLALFFVVGLGVSIIDKKWQSKILALLVLSIPFSNSAITEALNNDHRLAPMLPVGAIIVGYGSYLVLTRFKNMKVKKGLIIIFGLYLLAITIGFFTNRMTDKKKSDFDYLSMNLIYTLKKRLTSGNDFCLMASRVNAQKLDLAHNKETYEYFFPKSKIEIEVDESLGNNEIIISKNCQEKGEGRLHAVKCGNGFSFACPLKKEITFKYYLLF